MQTFVFLCTSPIAIEEGTHIYIWSLFQSCTQRFAAAQRQVQKYLDDHFSIQNLYIITKDKKKKNAQDMIDCYPSALICSVKKCGFTGHASPQGSSEVFRQQRKKTYLFLPQQKDQFPDHLLQRLPAALKRICLSSDMSPIEKSLLCVWGACEINGSSAEMPLHYERIPLLILRLMLH